MKLKSILLVVSLFFSSASLAYYYPQYPNPQAQASPAKILNYGLQRLRAFIETKNPSKAQLRAFIENEMVSYFDFDYMTKWSAGKYYNKLDAYQKEQVTDVIKQMFFSTLVKTLMGKKFPDIHFLRERAGQYSNELNVIALIRQKGNNRPIKITFRLYKSKTGWRVFDVKAGGRSAIMFYRRYLNKMFRRMQAEHLL